MQVCNLHLTPEEALPFVIEVSSNPRKSITLSEYWNVEIRRAIASDQNINVTEGKPSGLSGLTQRFDLSSGFLSFPGDAELPRRKPRLVTSAPPMTIPEFKAFVSQMGIETVRLTELVYWKSRKGPWFHEFIVVSLVPDKGFRPKVSIPANSPLSQFSVSENIAKGLNFRIDRGQRINRRSWRSRGLPSYQAAVDMIELMRDGVQQELESTCNRSFTLRHSSESDYPGNEPELQFASPRVFDLLFCLDRAMDAFGTEYRLLSQNCWTFASFIFQLMNILFTGFFQQTAGDQSDYQHSFREYFYGTKFTDLAIQLDQKSNLFGPSAMFGHRIDANLP